MAMFSPGSPTTESRADRARRARREINRAQTQGLDQASIVLSYLISGVLLWGGAGWLVDHLAGTRYLFTPIGIVIGAALGCYLIIHRFGALGRRGTPPADPGPPPDHDR